MSASAGTRPAAESVAPRFEHLEARIRLAVEAVAATDPNPSDPFRGLYISDELALSLSRGAGEDDRDARLTQAARLLGLDVLETAVLGLCAAPELDPRHGRLFAYLHDDVTRKLATPRLAVRLLAGDGVAGAEVLACFDHARALRRLGAVRLLDDDAAIPLADRPVKLAEALAAQLLGAGLDAPAARPGVRRVPLPRHDPGREASVAELRGVLGQPGAVPVVVRGDDGPAVTASALRRPLLVLALTDVGDAELLRDAVLRAALEGRRLCFDAAEVPEPQRRADVLGRLAEHAERAVVFARGEAALTLLGDRGAVVVEVPDPTLAERREAWRALSGAEAVEDVAAKFRLSVTAVERAAEVARLRARARGEATPTPTDLDLGARSASSQGLGELATRLEPAFGWDDLVLPPMPLEMLSSVCGYLRHRDLVLSGWGFERAVAGGQGLAALFAGESGTGKTMAAQVLARELGLDIFRVNLATIVSKYIGETEKNLDRVFAAAEGSNAILFFDEADALFGKRSEVHDSHDRYANIEVAYLLQQVEAYAGAVILATNFRQNLDAAFLRRLDVVVDFPLPETGERERIWRRLLPPTAPLAGDVDVPFLARQFKLSGGGIRNAALASAFLAAEEDGVISIRHLVRGVALEYRKLGRLTLGPDFEHFHEHVRTATP